MAWFRRRRRSQSETSPPTVAPPPSHVTVVAEGFAHLPPPPSPPFSPSPPPPPPVLPMLQAMAARIAELEVRLDAVSASQLSQIEVPTYDDLLEVRTHTAKVAAELARLEVNLAARLDLVRERIRSLEGDGEPGLVIDLRSAPTTPNDTGWPVPLTG